MKYFKIEEFDCQETGENNMNPEFLEKLDQLRHNSDFPFVITSGFRSVKHSKEVNKSNGGGSHTEGIAADIRVRNASERMIVVREAIKLGFTGIGVANSFVHVDTRTTSPVMWTYN